MLEATAVPTETQPLPKRKFCLTDQAQGRFPAQRKFFHQIKELSKRAKFGRDPWSSGNGKRLAFRRSWVIFVVKIVLFVWKD